MTLAFKWQLNISAKMPEEHKLEKHGGGKPTVKNCSCPKGEGRSNYTAIAQSYNEENNQQEHTIFRHRGKGQEVLSHLHQMKGCTLLAFAGDIFRGVKEEDRHWEFAPKNRGGRRN